ncbi:uncharacterized protein UV8b_04300 [Ustilaginoidea virens]|uniref:Uncharacterized protein n=1 Tax=Ustilaginoidea virens TaxID=1159556 RepID=A0A1B5KWQ6_USTVR|nr:uncharacterized protein UV8b_04300 [Ustilaginoidea virens]QUC20059.1 hypothetical protein UV8b_04300 [Ustilaginoidea virens]GAO14506.1 hypothetical protein UVI_02032170 [Ustilaginoidea virens]
MANQQTNGRTKGPKGLVLQTQPFRTASQKVKDGQQPSWFGGPTIRQASPRTTDAVIQSSTCITEPRSGSVSPSINFSYPRARAFSPTPSVDDHALIYDPNSRRMVLKSELMGHPQSLRQVSEIPKKRKKATTFDRTGSHLSKGSVGGRTKTTAPEDTTDIAPAPAVAQEQVSTPTRAPLTPTSQTTVDQQKDGSASNKRKKKKKKSAKADVGYTGKEIQEHGDDKDGDSLDKPSLAPNPHVNDEIQEEKKVEEKRDAQGDAQLPAATAATTTMPIPGQPNRQADSRPPNSKAEKQVRHIRVHSESPARSAHFAASSGDQLAVKHEPPPRSVSPRKSALKLSAQARGVSPSDSSSEASGNRNLSHDIEEATPTRKKSVRVSWDDRSTVFVGETGQSLEADSPLIPSPQTKKPWHSVVSRLSKKDGIVLAEDETMTPRPALPQFGSVREKKAKEPEERPLVRPSERAFALDHGFANSRVGHSTDAGVGNAMTQDLASKNVANMSKYREPLPAALPSIGNVPGQGGVSESSDEDFDSDMSSEPDDDPDVTVSTRSELSMTIEPSTPTKPAARDGKVQENVPIISVSPSSPCTNESPKAAPPGSFPDDRETTVDPIDESGGSGASTSLRSHEPCIVGTGMADIVEEDEETENDRFSDAYEDFDEVDGDGFLSLDAIVDGPALVKEVKKKSQGSPTTTEPAKVIERQAESVGAGKEPADAAPPDDWENAKAYWKSLSVEKRRQLEVEALSETGEDACASKLPAKNETSTAHNLSIEPGTERPPQEANHVNVDELDDHRQVSVAATPPRAADPGKVKLRQSMRSDAPTPTRDRSLESSGGMRKSMRNGHDSGKDGSLRPRHAETPAVPLATPKTFRNGQLNGGSLGPKVRSGRSASHHQPAVSGLIKDDKRNMSSNDLSTGHVMVPQLGRRGSDGSDSSFKRKRPASSSGDGHHHVRMSMRSSMREPLPTPDRAKRFSLRSLSPAASFRRNSFSSLPPEATSVLGGGSGRMRQSLRERPASSSSRLKMSGFRKAAGLGKKPQSGVSRFADSSDDDDEASGGPSLFRSRFADSSDEDEPQPLPKSKGLPKSLRNGNRMTLDRPAGNVAAPELAQIEEAVTQPKRGSAMGDESLLRRTRSGRGTLAPLPQNARPQHTSRRGSFMSILRRKKDTSDKVSKDWGESAARKDTNLERSAEELRELRSHSPQKRGPSWPLADGKGTADGEDGRSQEEEATAGAPSSGGATATATATATAASKMSTFLHRRSASQGAGALGPGHPDEDAHEPEPPTPDESLAPADAQGPQEPYAAKKRKKFGALRKMFGIHD